MTLTIYVLICVMLTATALLALKYWGTLGLIFGLIGAIFTYYTFQATTLIINSYYDTTAQTWVSQTMPMGFFAYVPLALALINFVAVLKK